MLHGCTCSLASPLMSPLYSACIAAARITPSSDIITLEAYRRPSGEAKNASREDVNSASSAKTVYCPSALDGRKRRKNGGGEKTQGIGQARKVLVANTPTTPHLSKDYKLYAQQQSEPEVNV